MRDLSTESMLTVKQLLNQAVLDSLDKLGLKNTPLKIEIEYPPQENYGDYTTNAAIQAAKMLNKPPLETAGLIAGYLRNQRGLKPVFSKIETAGPGFINFYLNPDYLIRAVGEILKKKDKWGQSKIGQGQKVQLEFISANPTGPLTIGNGRGGFFGDALGNVMKKCGFKVTKEYLINDAGKQIESLGHSVLKDGEAVYKGDYIDELHQLFQNRQDAYQVGQAAAKIILDKIIRQTVEEKMKVSFDVYFSEEKELRKTRKIAKVIKWLKKKNYLYEKDGAWWFKSAELGDIRDRVLVKSNGESTYLAQDFAYLVSKFKERKFKQVINIWGADHYGDVAGLLNAAKVLGYEGKQIVILMQFVRLLADGKEVRMSKRKGTYITMDELIDEVGHDVARFMFLMYAPSTHINFDLNLAKERSEKNPVYYVQYAHARIASILRQKELDNFKGAEPAGESALNDPAKLDEHEIRLIKECLKWPEILEEVSGSFQVQELPSYAIKLADRFHQFYTHCRVIDNGQVNPFRVKEVGLAKEALSQVLGTIGVSAPEKM